MKDIEKGWLCGIIDGDGGFRLGRRRRQFKMHNYETSWVPVMEIGSTEDKMIPEVQRICKSQGSCFVDRRKDQDGRRKNIYKYSLQANGLRWLLPQIVDHLVVKKEQAKLLMRVLEIYKRQGHRARSPAIEKELQEIYVSMRTLNIRGYTNENPQKFEHLKVRSLGGK